MVLKRKQTLQCPCAVRRVPTFDTSAQYLENWVAAAGPAGPVVYAACYAICAVLLLPASVLTLAAGYLFGGLMHKGRGGGLRWRGLDVAKIIKSL